MKQSLSPNRSTTNSPFVVEDLQRSASAAAALFRRSVLALDASEGAAAPNTRAMLQAQADSQTAAASIEALRREHALAHQNWTQQEHVLTMQLQQAAADLKAALGATAASDEVAANLRLDLEARPSIKDWKASQARVFQLEKQLSEAKSMTELRKYMDTRELIRRDKEVLVVYSALLRFRIGGSSRVDCCIFSCTGCN